MSIVQLQKSKNHLLPIMYHVHQNLKLYPVDPNLKLYPVHPNLKTVPCPPKPKTLPCPPKPENVPCPSKPKSVSCPSKPNAVHCPSKPKTIPCRSKRKTVPCPPKPKTAPCPSKPKTVPCPSKPKTVPCRPKRVKQKDENIAKNVDTDMKKHNALDMDRQTHQTNDFKDWKVKDLKEYISDRGVPTANYLKNDLIKLAEAIEEAKLPIDPDFAKDSLEHCLQEILTLPAGKRIPDPFKMTHTSKDMSALPRFGLLDIFNHLIVSKTHYDKEMLGSWRTFDEYKLHQNSHVRNLCRTMVYDNDDSKFHIIIGNVLPTQRDKTPEGRKEYRLWFIISPNGSVFSAFCECKGGSDQGCKHLGACMYELEEFLSGERTSVTSLPAYWQPKPKPKNNPLPLLEMKICHFVKPNRKRKHVSLDDSWVDSFDPMPN